MQDLLNDDWQNYLERMFIDVLCNPSSYAVISREDTKNKCYLKCINSYRGNFSIFLAVNSQITDWYTAAIELHYDHTTYGLCNSTYKCKKIIVNNKMYEY